MSDGWGMKRLLAVILFVAAAASAFAVNITALCTFEPPSGVVRQEPGVEYIVEAQRADGTWQEVARGPGTNVPNDAARLSFTYAQNVSWGAYTVRVTMTKPVASIPSDSASTNVQPGKPGNVRVERT